MGFYLRPFGLRAAARLDVLFFVRLVLGDRVYVLCGPLRDRF